MRTKEIKIPNYVVFKQQMYTAFKENKMEEATNYAHEYLNLSKLNQDWNFEDAVHHSNLVLGLIALKKGEVEQSKNHLIKAGKTKGNGVLKSFGPNMSLANELLKIGEREVVLEYISLIMKFWYMIFSWRKTRLWKKQILNNELPEFGGNLIYGMNPMGNKTA